MPTCNINNTPVTGFISIVINLVKQSKKSLIGSDIVQETEVRQWLEYCLNYASQCNNSQNINQILQVCNNFEIIKVFLIYFFKELNSVLELRTYLIGNCLSIADISLFYILHDVMDKLTYQEKEKYLNVSRWFDNIQQNNFIRKKASVVDFSTLFLTRVTIR